MSGIRSLPWLIIVLALGFLGLSAWSIYLAARGASTVTDADYYHHGLRYNQTLTEQHVADSLGWQVNFGFANGQLLVDLSDARRQPIGGAHGVLTLRSGDLAEPQKLPLSEAATGHYQVVLPAGLAGNLAADVDFERSGARLHRRLLLALPGR